jgi:Metallopeptidase family M24
MNRLDEFHIKVGRIRMVMRYHAVEGMLLSKRSNFAWLGCGANSRVFAGTDIGVGSLLVTFDDVYLISNNIENERLMAEELEGLPIHSEQFPWSEDNCSKIIERLIKGAPYGTDTFFTGGDYLGEELSEQRYELTTGDVSRYLKLGQDCEAVVSQACRQLSPGDSEIEISAALTHAAIVRGIHVPVSLVAADDRIMKYRHPMPTSKPIDNIVMVVMAGERGGLFCSLTRFVHFGEPSDELKHKHQAVCLVDATLAHNSTVGKPYGDVLQAGLDAYAEAGFGEEWKLHHQGGPTGYMPRDFKVVPKESRKVHINQAVAWNPSITGTKSEDTLLVSEDGIIYLTAAKDWPMVDIELDGKTYRRSDILVR